MMNQLGLRCRGVVLFDKRMPPHVKGNIQKIIVQPAILHVKDTMPMTGAHGNKLEVTEMQMNRWAAMGMRPHTKRRCDTL